MSSLDGKAVTGMTAQPRGGDGVVLEIVDEKDGANKLELDLADARELADMVLKAIREAESAAGR
jgi:hypothetical protein